MSLKPFSRCISAAAVLVVFTFAITADQLGVFSVAMAGKPGGGGGGGPRNVPICVAVDDASDITPDGGGDYCDGKKTKIDAFVGRNSGQFYLDTNTNLSPSGRSLAFYFPVGTTTEVFGPIGVDIYPNGFVPTNVWVLSARPQAGAETGYVDLRAMTEGDEAPIAVRLRLYLDGQNLVDLHYGDVLWAPGDPNSHVMGGELATVVGGPDEDGDGFSDCWIISGTTAWMNEVVNNNFNDTLPIGQVDMSFSFFAVK